MIIKADRMGVGNSTGLKIADISLVGGFLLVGVGIMLSEICGRWLRPEEVTSIIKDAMDESDESSEVESEQA